MALTYGTVTGRFEDTAPGIDLITGKVYFTAETNTLLSDDSMVLSVPVVATIVDNSFTVQLVATDDASLNPVDWTYRVEFDLKANGYTVEREGFSIKVPAGTTVDLRDVAPVTKSGGIVILRGEKGEDGVDGTNGTNGVDGVAGPAGPAVQNTGWRDIKGSLLNGWTATNVRIRREGNMVSFILNNVTDPYLTGGSPSVLINLPTGFRPDTSVTNASVPVVLYNSSFQKIFGTASLNYTGDFSLAALSSSATSIPHQIIGPYFTSNPWPGTLPGTAA